jgi:hypothetical protein
MMRRPFVINWKKYIKNVVIARHFFHASEAITMIARRHFPGRNVHLSSPNVGIPPPVAMEKAVAVVTLAN